MNKKKYLLYKEKPMFRSGQTIYYGSPWDKYYIQFDLDNFDTTGKTKVAKKVVVLLVENQNGMGKKNKIIKKAQREGLYAAMDIGMFWLEDALSWK